MESKPKLTEPNVPPSKGTVIVETHRPMMSALSDSQREDHYKMGMQLIYGGGSAKAEVRRG